MTHPRPCAPAPLTNFLRRGGAAAALPLTLLAWTACASSPAVPPARPSPASASPASAVTTVALVPSAASPAPAAPAATPAVSPPVSPAVSSPVSPPSARPTPDAPFRAEAPAAGPEPTFRVPPFKRFRLQNGADVILAEFHELPLIEMHVVVRSGGAVNPPGQAGLADLTANMLDEGTKTRSALEIAEQIGSLGAALGSGASWDASTLTMATISRNFDKVLAIWADVLTHPAFAEEELTRVRDNLVTAVARRKDSPPAIAGLTLTRVLFGDRHPYAWPQSGTEESLKKLGVHDVRRFYETYYHPSNATIIVAGDITEAELRQKLPAALRDWKSARVPVIKLGAPPTIEKKKIYFIDKPGAPQSSIRVGFVGMKRTDPDYFPVLLMNQILGGSFYRLDMNLRERQQWTYGARSTFDLRRTPGPASAGGEFIAAHTADAVAEILKEMRIMSTTEVSDEELSRAKDNFTKSFPARFATRASTAAVIGELAVYGLPDRFLSDYDKNVEAVTKADVRRVAAKYLQPERSAIVVVGDRASQEAALAKLASVELRDLEGGPLVANHGAPAGLVPSSKSDSVPSD
jgi:zinc protease